ncbi:hypothetical protein CSV63_03685 [Sporosarcina sp. P34]|uniref:hypothetical protein n=1 Tax=Sporosarcina sp. P34 TaxID=2048247 RepID=UPI000C163F50|nr:hypothetical protein [Sporosarcina sp. P34]PID16996.1 hypothetical protein CSV63_03685 [Sporosarcina sp. P34]
MLKATENAKPVITTMEPIDFGWDKFSSYDAVADQTKSDILEAFVVEGKEGYRNDELQLVPGKEGTTSLKLSVYSKGTEMETKKFIVDVKKVDGKLQVSLTETKDFISQAEKLGAYMTNKDKQKVESISLSTLDAKKLPKAITSLTDVMVSIEEPGQYIAVVRFKNGKQERHVIEAVTDLETLKDSVRVIKEVKTAEYTRYSF